MALNKEIWVSDVQNLLLPDNSFVTKGTDYSAFADAHTIHIPVEAGNVNVEIDRSVLPGAIGVSDDTERAIMMHHFTTDPVRLFRPEDVELSYDKRSIITKKIADSLNNKIAEYALGILANNGGVSMAANAKVTDTLRTVALEFDRRDYPEADRYVLLSAEAYSKLFKELTDAQTNAFLAVANASTGVIGGIFGLNILKRSTVGEDYNVISWHKRDYMYALGPTEIYTQENAPEYYGTIISASARFGAYTFEENSSEPEPGNGD